MHLPDLLSPADPSDWKKDDVLYLTLRPDGVTWKPVGLSRELKKGEPGDVALRAKYVRRENYGGVTEPGQNMPVDIFLDIGVDHYYAAEKAAKEIEKDGREAPLEVILSVGGDGHAAIKGLVVKDEKRYETFF
ncbi:MAG: GDYXXLXY domain-containing protein [Alphaproteobacteria bacterium]